MIGMEACGSSQDWARKLEAMGHEVHLMSPKAVKPFVSGQKNDHNDAIGIYKAMFNGVRRVPVKSTEIRDLQTLRRIRSQVTKDKVKEINHVRGLLVVQSINTLSIKQMRTQCLQASISSGRSPVPHSLA